jgi:site-specific recombinase XerD
VSTDLPAAFLTYAEHDRNRSPHTLARYRATLTQIPNVAEATQAEIQAWWETRYHLSPATRSNELACLRSFYRYLTKFDLRPDDPTRRLDPPKVPNHVPRAVGATDLERLLGPLTVDALEVRRAVALGAYGGLRVSEAAGLDWRDVDVESRRIFVRGKGQRERAVGLSVILLDKIAPEVAGNVITAGGRPISGATLQRKVNRLMERHGIRHSYHDLRKRGATMALAKGGNPAAVRQMFGWSSMQTVSHYAVVGDEELDRIAEMMT